MFELFIFIISSFIIYTILGNLIVKIKGKKLGCFSFAFTIMIAIFISLGISKKVNPNKAESFFYRDEIDKKVEKYKSAYEYKNKDYLQQLSQENYYNFSDRNSNKELKIGCLCRDGTIISSIQDGTCSNNGGIYEKISIEIENYIPPKKSYQAYYSAPEQSNSGGEVYVRGYHRKDGTYVKSHTRRAPRR